MKLRTVALLCALAFLFQPIVAQEDDERTPQPPTRGGDSDRGRDDRERGQRQEQPRQDSYTRPIFLTGSVELDDGTPVPESVRVSLICNNNVVDQAFTQLDGQFSFQLGDHRPTTVMDASASGAGFGEFGGRTPGVSPQTGQMGQFGGRQSGGIGRVDMSHCEIQAALPGFVSDMLRLGVRSVLDNPDVGTIVLHRSEKTPGTTVSLTTLAAPEDATKSYEKARKELAKKKPNVKNATQELEKAVDIYPEFSAAWYLLGNLRKEDSDLEGARNAYQKAVAGDHQYIPPYLGLAEISLQENKMEEVEQYAQDALKLNPAMTVAHYFNAVANYSSGEMEPAEESLRTIKKTDGEADRFPMTYYMLGVIEANRGNYEEAAADLERLLEVQPEFSGADNVEEQLDQWEEAGLIVRQENQEQK